MLWVLGLLLVVGRAAGEERAVADPDDEEEGAPRSDALPDERLHVGIGAGFGIYYLSTSLSSSETGFSDPISFGPSTSLRLRTARGLTVEPEVDLRGYFGDAVEVDAEGDTTREFRVHRGVEVGLQLRPVLGRRGASELCLSTGLGWRHSVTNQHPTDPDDLGEAEAGSRSLRHGVVAPLGLSAQRWITPWLTLSGDLDLLQVGYSWQRTDEDFLRGEEAERYTSTKGVALETDIAARLLVHVYY